jgi:hypothetical protein
VVAEMPRAAVIVKATGATELPVFQHAHSGIRQATDLALLCIVRCYFHYGAPDDFIRAEEPELNANNGLRFGAV